MKTPTNELPRATDGKFAKHECCEACRKPVTGEMYSDDETVNLPGAMGAGLTLCGRKRCIAKRDAMPIPARVTYYSRTEA